MTNRSDIPAPHPVQPRARHALMFWTTAAICFLIGARPSQAAGCHVQDRPVVSGTLSWEARQEIAPETAQVSPPPPVLTHTRCGDEIPLASPSSNLPVVAALFEASNYAPPDFSVGPVIYTRPEHIQPTAIRVDRPPRSGHRCLS
jgi:hypothetical protein